MYIDIIYRVVQAPTIMKQLGALKLLCVGMEDLSVFGLEAQRKPQTM